MTTLPTRLAEAAADLNELKDAVDSAFNINEAVIADTNKMFDAMQKTLDDVRQHHVATLTEQSARLLAIRERLVDTGPEARG